MRFDGCVPSLHIINYEISSTYSPMCRLSNILVKCEPIQNYIQAPAGSFLALWKNDGK